MPLPWLLTPADLAGVNAFRAALSGSLGAEPAAHGEGASSLQLQLMKMSVAARPELSPNQAQIAAATSTSTAPPPHDALSAGSSPEVLLPPLEIAAAHLFAAPAAPALASAEDDDEALFDYDDDKPGVLELLG